MDGQPAARGRSDERRRGDWAEEGRLAFVVGLEAFDIDAGNLVTGGHGDGALLWALDFPDRGQNVALDLAELLVGDFPELEAHLRLEELVAQRRVVLRLGFGRLNDLVEHETQAADQEAVENEHILISVGIRGWGLGVGGWGLGIGEWGLGS